MFLWCSLESRILDILAFIHMFLTHSASYSGRQYYTVEMFLGFPSSLLIVTPDALLILMANLRHHNSTLMLGSFLLIGSGIFWIVSANQNRCNGNELTFVVWFDTLLSVVSVGFLQLSFIYKACELVLMFFSGWSCWLLVLLTGKMWLATGNLVVCSWVSTLGPKPMDLFISTFLFVSKKHGLSPLFYWFCCPSPYGNMYSPLEAILWSPMLGQTSSRLVLVNQSTCLKGLFFLTPFWDWPQRPKCITMPIGKCSFF